MDNPRKLHPVLWVAAVSVILLSAAGIGAITGLIPHAGGQSADTVKAEAQPAPTQPGAQPAQPLAAVPPTSVAPPPPASAVQEEPPRVVRHHKPTHLAQAETAAPPPGAVAPPPGTPYPPTAATPAPQPRICRDCGTIEAVRAVKQQGQGTGLGAIAGGLIGGLLGNQVGGGHGRDLATVAGAVAGGYAGNEVEKNQRAVSHYQIVVRFEDGTTRVFSQQSAPAWQPGDRVRVENGAIVPRS